MKKKFELMAPAGDWRSFHAAIEAGADAVYFGLKEFNMRQTTRNFSLRDIEKMQEYNVKKYLTLNTIIYDNEIKKIEKIIKKVKGKIDAIICWDPSVIWLCKKYRIPFHISTQASVSNSKAAEFYKKLGAKRIILARELNLKQIKEIVKKTGIEIEIFIHGALCVSISGRCFTSQFLHKKSANRGECLQPCRREYKVIDDEGNELKLKNNFVMSAKDLCTLPFIEKIKNSGATAFKIEGRNRNAEYVYEVTKVYREALDKRLNEKKKKELMKRLEEVYNRKFSSGFYLGLPTSDDFSDVRGSVAKTKKKIIGKVENYYKKLGVAVIRIYTDKIKINDTLVIMGNKTGVKKFKIKSMEINHKKVKIAKKGLVAIKSPEVRKNDEVYKLVKN